MTGFEIGTFLAYLAAVVLPVVCETTPHRRMDHAVARLLLGQQGKPVHCAFRTPGGERIDIDLTRTRRTDPQPRRPDARRYPAGGLALHRSHGGRAAPSGDLLAASAKDGGWS